MDTLDGGAALREHLDRNPEARHAALHDPEYAAEVHRLRMVLVHLDTALTAEGLPGEARQRISARLVADHLGTDEANARGVRDRARAVQDLWRAAGSASRRAGRPLCPDSLAVARPAPSHWPGDEAAPRGMPELHTVHRGRDGRRSPQQGPDLAARCPRRPPRRRRAPPVVRRIAGDRGPAVRADGDPRQRTRAPGRTCRRHGPVLSTACF